MKGQKTNPRLIFLINDLKAATRQNGVGLWRDIAKRLEKPRRNYAAVNLSKINRHTKNNDIVIIPGKVLAAGDIDHSVIVGALSFSSQAAAKILAAGGKCLELNKLAQEHPEGTGIRILR